MRELVADLRAEGAELDALLGDLRGEDWSRPTPFKQWTVNDVVAHLHAGDWLAVQSLKHPERFPQIVAARNAARERGEEPASAGIGPEPTEGPALRERWRSFFFEMCDLLEATDPSARLQWVGPDMSARSFASARQMETWAHGHDIYDLLCQPRTYTDRIRNIAVLGCRTFGWTFRNRGLEPPAPVPYVRLTAPSGAVWEWHEPSDEHRVEGSAVEFCHVVTQGRNIADANLRVTGEPATRWMSIAQCFAGPPRDPPAPGERAWERRNGVR